MVRLQRLVFCGVAWQLAACWIVSAGDSLKQLEAILPTAPRDFSVERTLEVRRLCEAAEQWMAEVAWSDEKQSPQQTLRDVKRLIDAKHRVDAALDELLTLRSEFGDRKSDQSGREAIRQFLQTASHLIDLSGRMRFSLRDGIDNASYALSPHSKQLDEMIDLLLDQRVAIGAAVMIYALFDPLPESGVKPFPLETKRKVLSLIAATKQTDLLYDLVELIAEEQTPDGMIVEVAKVIRAIGLPQAPFSDSKDRPPVITPSQLREVLSKLAPTRLTLVQRRDRTALIEWLDNRIELGIRGAVFRYGNLELRSGDWLLMRNPSPYNMFTDLAPGLFTHVGVVSAITDKNGVRRFVIVDLPERGDRIPATTVDEYLHRTLHYCFLRHRDPKVQHRLGYAAAEMIGNETQFDLTFKTSRVLELKGKPLQGQRINTYCAGFLLLCAQATGRPRSDFFSMPERQPGGFCGENLKKLGLSIGEDFVSPTGAIFSPKFEIVARREPMYSPARHVKEAVYDHFAQRMTEKKLTPAPNTYQALREKIAGLSKFNPWLAKALAKANNVSQHMDLQAAAKASAVIETLDEVADSSADGFIFARQAMNAAPNDELADEGYEPREIQRIKQLRQRHADLFARWIDNQITPRELRISLVKYYQQLGENAIDDRFFSSEK